MFAVIIGKTYWAIRSPWAPVYFMERNGYVSVYPIGFGWRITKQPVPGRGP